MRFVTLLLALFLVSSTAIAQTPGNCELGTVESDLYSSDVVARLFTTGSLFFGNSSEAAYLVPKATGLSPQYAAGLWVGGMIGGDLRVAGSTYSQFEFWPGPLSDGATLPNPDDCSDYDRIWNITVLDVDHYENGGDPTGDLAGWPVGLGAPAVDMEGQPITPSSREQVINLANGERPVIYGSQTAFWVMNDVGNVHENTLTEPIGLEVQVLAWSAISEDDAVNQATFYRYRLINRNTLPFEDAYFTRFSDPDLGDAGDDYVGADTSRGMAFVYNEGEVDSPSSGGYGVPPAFGYDFLDEGIGSHVYYLGGVTYPHIDPNSGEQIYQNMQGLWLDGSPIYENELGHAGPGKTTTYAFPGDPVVGAFWSEENGDGMGTPPVGPGDRRHSVTTPTFDLAPGEHKDFHIALLFAWGDDRLDSIVDLRAASDLVQAKFDDGSLFETASLPTQLATPSLVFPEDDGYLHSIVSPMSWSPVAGATMYHVEWADNPDFVGARMVHTTALSRDELLGPHNTTVYWRVRASGDGGLSLPSEIRTYEYYQIDWGLDGTGIHEVAYPGVSDPCEGHPDDPGCQQYNANMVWHDGNSTGDYYITTRGSGVISTIKRYLEASDHDVFEIRFTAEGSLGVYAFTDNTIVDLPFEIWNIGDPDNPNDDERMIPFINENDVPLSSWADNFTGTDGWIDGPGSPISDWIYGMMPDRPSGYDLFAAAAEGFGGPGSTYDETTDGDDQPSPDPFNGGDCSNDGYYANFCYNNDLLTGTIPGGNQPGSDFVYPVGRIVFADLAEDGTTPPTGTVVRLTPLQPRVPIGVEESGGEGLPDTYALLPAYPNPFNPRALVPFEVSRAGEVKISVFDLLGREIATLVNGQVAAGRHEAVLDGTAMTSGVYLVRMEAEGDVQGLRKVVLLR